PKGSWRRVQGLGVPSHRAVVDSYELLRIADRRRAASRISAKPDHRLSVRAGAPAVAGGIGASERPARSGGAAGSVGSARAGRSIETPEGVGLGPRAVRWRREGRGARARGAAAAPDQPAERSAQGNRGA